MIFCTILTAADIPKAKIMAMSVKRYFANSKVVICLVEQSIHQAAKDSKCFDDVILANELRFDWPKLDRIIFKYNAIEAVSAMKGQFLKDLLKLYKNEDYFIYLDPEMKLFSPCSELFNALREHSIVVTPHQLVPSDPDHISREIELLKEGTFHGGLLAIRRTDNSTQFIEWFADRLNRFYEDPHKGLHLDKKFLNLAMAAFNLHILKHPAYNVAVWNFHERMTIANDGSFHVQGKQLCIFNFSNLEGWRAESNDYEYKYLSNEPWSYDFFNNGEKISMETRIKYRTNPTHFDHCLDLFAESNSNLLQKHG
jgi:hypothetical protein